jgi:hypothetical protein
MGIDIFEKRFTSDEVAAAAGCREGTLRQWRSRHGLLSETSTGGMEVKHFSLVDVCVVRAVQVLTTSGISTSDAIAAAVDEDMRYQITILLSEREPFSPPLFGFHLNQEEPPSCILFHPKQMADAMAVTKGVLIVFDATMIIDHVRKALKIPASGKGK